MFDELSESTSHPLSQWESCDSEITACTAVMMTRSVCLSSSTCASWNVPFVKHFLFALQDDSVRHLVTVFSSLKCLEEGTQVV